MVYWIKTHIFCFTLLRTILKRFIPSYADIFLIIPHWFYLISLYIDIFKHEALIFNVCLENIFIKGEIDWIGLDLFNDDTCPSGHISRPTQVNMSQSCFNSLNILLKVDYIVQVWGLVEVNCVISDRRIPLLKGIPLCKSRELSRRGYSTSQLCSIHHDIPVTLHTPGAYGQ